MPDPTVTTTHGRLRGFVDHDLHHFRGIPFAAPPTGLRRFAPPAPADSWTGERDATLFGMSAPQNPVPFDLIDLDVGPTAEDCLTLNVVTPGTDDARRPVLVWIHGGAFTIGPGSQEMYDSRPLARRGDVVVVSINYRLGALGFLALGAEGTTANAGLLDQVAALRWVRDNIAGFGGDPDEFTIFGESAGGMSVGCLLGMPEAQGLFHRAIPMSGAAHATNSPESSERVAAELCRELGVAEGEAQALRQIPVDAILKAQSSLEQRFASSPLRLGFRPNVGDASLPEPPYEAIRGGLSKDVPVLVGATRDEWRLLGLADTGVATLDEAKLTERIEGRAPGHGARIVRAYADARPDASPSDLFFAIETDRIFRVPAIRLGEAQSAHQPATFAYLYTWESPAMGGRLGACHGVDVPFVFGLIGTKGADFFAGRGAEAEALAQRTMDAWLGFARNGDPGHPDWTAFEPSARQTMLLGPECQLVSDPFGAERAAWDGVIP